MDGDQRFHITWIGLVCTVVICLICCITIYNVYEISAVESMSKQGIDPLKATCAIDHNTDCKILYSK